jgi:hypothetical protein
MTGSPYKKIKFVRCPYDRAVSCYFIYCKILHHPENSLPNPQKRIPSTILRKQNPKPQLDPAMDLSFLDFLKILKTTFRNVNRHPSSAYPDPIAWDHVIHVENMKEELAKIGVHDLGQMNLQNFHKDLEKTNWNKARLGSARQSSCLSKEPFRNINTKNSNYVDFYNGECKMLVRQLYKIDFQCHPEYTWDKFLRRNHRS